MERNTYTIPSPDPRPYPLYSPTPSFNSPPQYQPNYNNNVYAPTPTYARNNSQTPYPISQNIPAQNYYRVQPEMQMRPQSSAFSTQFVSPQSGPYYTNPQQNWPINYQTAPYLAAARQPNQTSTQNRPTTTQYVPIELQQQRPGLRLSPPSMIYNLNSQPVRYQPVVVQQPQFYDRREVGYRPVPDRVAAAKQVASQIRYQDPYQNQNPMVRTVEKSFSAGSVRSSRHNPPPPVQQRKTACPIWILGVLGVVGLVGLILALVLGQNSKGIAVVQTTAPTVAQPQKANTPTLATTPTQPTTISPSKDVTNAVVNGQTAVTTPTIVTPATNDLPKVVAPTALSVNPTDISLTHPTSLPTTVQPISLQTPQTLPTLNSNNNVNPPTVQPTAVPSIAASPNTVSAIYRPQTISPIPAASNTPTPKPAHFLAQRHNS